MNNQETKLLEQTKNLTQPAPRKSNWQAKKNYRLALRFSPTAWAKLLYFRDKSDDEVGGFGITEPEDLLFVTDFVTVKQEVTSVSVKFDDNAVADLFDVQVDLGRKPEQFARIWLHSHPGDFAEPSLTDEQTFEKVFGICQWAVMFIIAQSNKTYARLKFNVGPGGNVLIPSEIDYCSDFAPSNHQLWDAEFHSNITTEIWQSEIADSKKAIDEKVPAQNDTGSLTLPYDFIDEFEKMDLVQRQLIIDELAEREDLWDDEGVMYL